MNFKVDDWVRHPTYGDGQVSEDRGDKYLIQFVTQGERLMLKQAIESAGQPPYSGFSFGKRKPSGTPQFKVVRVKREPAPDFTHLVKRFLDVFEGGFEAESFDRRERQYKERAAGRLRGSLGRQQLDDLLYNEQFGEVCDRALHVVKETNLIFKQEIMKLITAFKNEQFRRAFATDLRELLYGAAELETRFNSFAAVLAHGEVAIWTIATYFQFLLSDGELMFMKPTVTKKMSESLNIALNYRSEPNWLTYSKLQELAMRTDSELRARGLKPHSGIDLQGFIWASIKIEEGKYGKEE
jgi:hypothetical protein